MTDTPNPGSREARDAGCICAVLDNNFGRVAPWPPDGWCVTGGCLIHDPDNRIGTMGETLPGGYNDPTTNDLRADITLRVHGTPAPQGSKTKMPNGAMLEAASATGRAKVANWRNDVRTAAEKWRTDNGDPPLIDAPISMHVQFHMPRPKTRRHEQWVSTKPDTSKLLRATEDALTGVIWRDDALVADLGGRKQYATDDELPGAHIWIAVLQQPPKPERRKKGDQ